MSIVDYVRQVWKDNRTTPITSNSLKHIENGIYANREYIKQCFQSVSNGKTLVASAITDKGVTTASDATFAVMAQNIRNIPSGGTSKDTVQYLDIGLSFVPDEIIYPT